MGGYNAVNATPLAPMPVFDPAEQALKMQQIQAMKQEQQTRALQQQQLQLQNQQTQMSQRDQQAWTSALAKTFGPNASGKQPDTSSLPDGAPDLGPDMDAMAAEYFKNGGSAQGYYSNMNAWNEYQKNLTARGTDKLNFEGKLDEQMHGATQDIYDAKADPKQQVMAQQKAQQTIMGLAQTARDAGDIQMARRLYQTAQKVPTDAPMDEDTLETIIGYQNLHNTLAARAKDQAETNKNNADAAQKQGEATKLQLTNPFAAQQAQATANETTARARLEQNQADAIQQHPEIANVLPHLVPAATKEIADAGKAYSKTVAGGRDMQSFYDMANAGNTIAYAYNPVLGVLNLNTEHGTTRVNMAEIHSYGGAGSALDRVEGFFGKQTSGASIPKNVLQDMLSVSKQMTANARDKYADDVKVTNSTYKSNFPTTPPIGAAGGQANAALLQRYAR
jgi:hypothetical protein